MEFILLSIAAIWILAYFKAHRLIWTGFFALLFSLWMIAGGGLTGVRLFISILFVAAAIIINVPIFRRSVVIEPVFALEAYEALFACLNSVLLAVVQP